jgi:hypothetical protein
MRTSPKVASSGKETTVRDSITRSSRRFSPPVRAARQRRAERAQPIDFELGFEIPNLLTQGKLGGVQAVRGAAEMAIFRDRDEISKVAKLQADLSDRWEVSILSEETIGRASAKRTCS